MDRLDEHGGLSMKKFGLSRYTLDHFFAQVVSIHATRPALALIGETPFSYAEFGRRVQSLISLLQAMGIKKQDRIILLGNSCPNWAIAFLSIMTYGAVAVPILEDFPESDIDHIIKHSDAVGIFISESLYQSLNLPAMDTLSTVICINDLSVLRGGEKNRSGLWNQLQSIPEKLKKTLDKSSHSDSYDEIREDDPAEILYTSGTTGHSKGVMLTHRNLVSNLFEGPDLLKVIDNQSVVLSILPLAHAFGSTSALLSIIYCGAAIYYLNKPPSPKILTAALQQVKPTILGAVPLVFEKIYHKQVAPVIAQKKVFQWLCKMKPTKRLLYRLIGRKVYRALGGRLKCVIIGGACLSPEVEAFLKDGRIPYCLGYGLSECSPLVTFSSMQTQKPGSPGHAISDTHLKIVEPEIR